MRIYFLTFFLFLGTIIFSQECFFRSPVDHDILLSGTFAELRPNHFHSGIDIKPGPNDNIYAICDGWISRIRATPVSYGRAIYINHPNGLTSVYAHLDHFNERLDFILDSLQHVYQSFEIDHVFRPNAITINKGEVLGKMGNKGNSFGKHLHFELRNSVTELAINPLLYDFNVKDYEKPYFNGIYIYELDSYQNIVRQKYYPTSFVSGVYSVNKGLPIAVNTSQIGISFRGYDKSTLSNGNNGLYAINMTVDGLEKFQFKADSFSFDQTRYINAHIDYPEKKTKGSYFNRCHLLKGNKLNMITSRDRGYIVVDASTNVKIVIEDIYKNAAALNFTLTPATTTTAPTQKSYNYLLYHDQNFSLRNEDFTIEIPSGYLYEDYPINFSSKTGNAYSQSYSFGSTEIPLHDKITMSIKPTTTQNSHQLVAYTIHSNGLPEYFVGKMDNGYFNFYPKNLGTFQLDIDVDKPYLVARSFSPNKKLQQFTFTAKDEKSGIATYEAFVDGHWEVLEYDKKNNLLIFSVPKNLYSGEHNLIIKVVDGVGNEALFNSKFIY